MSAQQTRTSPRNNAASRPRACKECRQQKLKCDAHLDYSKPCSRCRALGIDCVFTANFKRRKFRPKAEMQREIDCLQKFQKEAASVQQPEYLTPPSISIPPQANMRQRQAISTSSIANHYPSSADVSVAASSYLHTSPLSVDMPPTASQSKVPADTFCPTLDGVMIEPQKLDDCFSLYFKHYHPILPILDPWRGCGDYYKNSCMLYWTIIVTGSRRYHLDPTLLEVLAPKVAAMAAMAMTRPSEYTATISGLLILCAWPLPIENSAEDPSSVYSGIVLQLCLQNGLHMRSKRQDFSQSPLVTDANEEIFRERLWAWCKVVCRCVNIYSGVPPHVFEDAWDRDELDSSDLKLYWMQRLESAMSRALSTLMQGKYDTENVEMPTWLPTMIRHFDEEINQIKLKSLPHLSSIWFTATRLHLGAYYFFSPQRKAILTPLIEVYYIACSFIDIVQIRDRQDDYALYLSEQFYRTLSLAAITILRICRSPELKSTIDRLLGEQAYFAAIQILKKRVLKNNDLNAQMATILSQLWQSERVFRQQDSSYDSLNVRIRTRGEMGIVYDCLWYWRQEFRGESNPYVEGGSSNNNQKVAVRSFSSVTSMPSPSQGAVAIQPSLEQQQQQQQQENAASTEQQQFPRFDGNSFPTLPDDDGFFSEWNWSVDGYFYQGTIDQSSGISFSHNGQPY